MSLLRTIKERRSTLSFKRERVELSILQEIFTYGSYAPTHYMTEAWRMKLYQGDGKARLVQAIIESYQRSGMLPTGHSERAVRASASIADFLMEIPHHALIYYDKPDDPIRNEEEYSSIAAFIQNAQLAAWEFGVGMLWTITPYMQDDQFIEKIGLDREKHKIAAVLQIGYPEKTTRDKGRTPVKDWMEIIE